jgi:hypothetical protein
VNFFACHYFCLTSKNSFSRQRQKSFIGVAHSSNG